MKVIIITKKAGILFLMNLRMQVKRSNLVFISQSYLIFQNFIEALFLPKHDTKFHFPKPHCYLLQDSFSLAITKFCTLNNENCVADIKVWGN